MSVKDKADAIDRFVRTLKSSGGLWDDIQAACIMAGWTNLAGALTPFKGAAPTNNGFLAADYESTLGIETTYNVANYIDANYPANTNATDDTHASCYLCSKAAAISPYTYTKLFGNSAGSNGFFARFYVSSNALEVGPYSTAIATVSDAIDSIGLIGFSRSDNANATLYADSQETSATAAAATPFAGSIYIATVGSNNTPGAPGADYRFSFYSLGTATDLAALDSAVSALMADLRSIDEAGFDRDALAYIRAVEAADGSFLETGVKQAINSFIVGLKKDNLWNALKASAILCGARTIAGALVPLAGTAPTPYNFAGGDYSRTTGLKGDGATKYLDSNRAGNADGLDDKHASVYITQKPTLSSFRYYFGTYYPDDAQAFHSNLSNVAVAVNGGGYAPPDAAFSPAGLEGSLLGVSRQDSATMHIRGGGVSLSVAAASIAARHTSKNQLVYGIQGTQRTDARLAFYSIGSAISDLALLDARVSTLVSQIAAAIP